MQERMAVKLAAGAMAISNTSATENNQSVHTLGGHGEIPITCMGFTDSTEALQQRDRNLYGAQMPHFQHPCNICEPRLSPYLPIFISSLS